ncbi:MAG: hypothetical protein OEW26_00875, partial [Nitrospirota bacterium]|nr:hypothetical protein [Nitrospirota bacterium]
GLGRRWRRRIRRRLVQDQSPNCQGMELYPLAGYSDQMMTTKQKVLKAVETLPDDASFEDAMERLLFLAKVEKGIQQADAGQTIPHEQVKQKM